MSYRNSTKLIMRVKVTPKKSDRYVGMIEKNIILSEETNVSSIIFMLKDLEEENMIRSVELFTADGEARAGAKARQERKLEVS